jgi:hypothetical protein
MNKVWTKTVKRRLVNKDLFFGGFFGSFAANREDIGFIGLHFDDKDNIYYCFAPIPERNPSFIPPAKARFL